MINKYNDVKENVSLENYNTYGIKTKTRYLIKPTSIDELTSIVNDLNNENLKYYILGKGSNVILPDTPFNGAIISLEHLNKINYNDNIVYAEAGCILGALAIDTINHNLKGLENLANIPGTLGGALFGNAGACGNEIYDYIKSVTVIRDNNIITLEKENIEISYRKTMFSNSNDIIVACEFVLENGNKDELLEVVKENRKKRKDTQPLEYKNAGSVFRNPEGLFAGKLIEDAYLKGLRVNDAVVSEKHANFIINVGNASSKDILDLIALVKEKVYNTYEIELELEQKIVKWDENEREEEKENKN